MRIYWNILRQSHLSKPSLVKRIELKKVIHNISDYFNWVRKMLNNTTIPMTGIKLLSETGMLFVIILGSILLKNNEIPRETFIMSLIFANMLVNSFQKITSFHHTKIMFEKNYE